MRKIIKQIMCLILVTTLLISSNAIALNIKNNNKNIIEKKYDIENKNGFFSSLDIDYKIVFTVKEIRAFDKIDLFNDPDFYVVIYVNDDRYQSPCWNNQKYVIEDWSTDPIDVPDDDNEIKIKIQLWDKNIGKDKLCDISDNEDYGAGNNQYDVDLIYDLKSGHWRGDDEIYPLYYSNRDYSGYGRLNGCDDNSIYENDRDCELIFDITQNDPDGDGIPYWTEINEFGTDPEVNDSGLDTDNDNVPIEWEFKWGHYFGYDWKNETYISLWYYDPFITEDHANIDFDYDGLQNTEEYLTSQWGSDPYRQDIFLELDQMELGPDGEGAFVPDLSKEFMKDPFRKHNIVLHIDDGCMGGGQVNVSFAPSTNHTELIQIYKDYFLHNDPNNWRRGTFHYAIVVYNSTDHPGFAFRTSVNDINRLDSFLIESLTQDVRPVYKTPIRNILMRKSLDPQYHRVVGYASAMMHETGHVLGIFRSNTPGCDNKYSVIPNKEWLKFRCYKSCMNYNYIYYLIDYSDGSRGKNDFDDWQKIDLTLFEKDL